MRALDYGYIPKKWKLSPEPVLLSWEPILSSQKTFFEAKAICPLYRLQNYYGDLTSLRRPDLPPELWYGSPASFLSLASAGYGTGFRVIDAPKGRKEKPVSARDITLFRTLWSGSFPILGMLSMATENFASISSFFSQTISEISTVFEIPLVKFHRQ